MKLVRVKSTDFSNQMKTTRGIFLSECFCKLDILMLCRTTNDLFPTPTVKPLYSYIGV